jgi:hypothetical protein
MKNRAGNRKVFYKKMGMDLYGVEIRQIFYYFDIKILDGAIL